MIVDSAAPTDLDRLDPDATGWRLFELRSRLPLAMLDALNSPGGPEREAARRALDGLRAEIDRLQHLLDGRP